MNFVKKYQINDVLDRLEAKYGDDWENEAPFGDPDIGRIKDFRNAIELHDRQRKYVKETKIYGNNDMVVMFDTVTQQTSIFNTVKDVAKLLTVTRTRVNQAIREQGMIKHRFKLKRQAQYVEDGGF
jgi:phage antirepressor YoqD-like protein